MLSHRKGILLDGIGSELVRASSGGVRKTLSKWLGDLSAAITLGDVASVFTSGDATPSVLNNSKFITDGATAITNFDDGVEGQTITIYRGASDIVITDNATIDTIIAGNLSLTAARPSATFRLASGVWKQVEEAGAVATTFLAVMQAATVALSRIALGFPAALDALWTAATVGAARIALGFAAALDTLWTASSLVAAIRALGQAPSVEAYGAVGDLRDVYDAGITSGLAVLTSATLAATSADVGKTVVIQGAGAVQLFSIRKPLVATILSLNSATSVNLSATASATVSNANAAIGTDNTTFFQNAINSGYKKILAYGHYLIAGTLTFPLDNFHFQGAGGIIDRQSLNYGNGSTATTGMDVALPKVGTRLLWAGTFGNPVTLFAPSSALGYERKHFGNGLRDMVIDCAGQTCTGVAVRGQQSMEIWNVSVVRFQRNLAVGTQYTTSQYDGAWDLASSYGSSLTFWDMRGFRARGMFAINRGSPYAGAVGVWLHGDKIKGNVNYLDIEGEILIEDDGAAISMHVESVDTSDFSRFRWNAQAVFHAADTGFRSTLNGNTTAANDSTHPASQARSCHISKGGYAVLEDTAYTDGVTAAKFFAARNHTMVPASAENIGVPPNVKGNAQAFGIYEGTGSDNGALVYGGGHPVTQLYKASQSVASGALGSPALLTWAETGAAYDEPGAFASGTSTTNIVVPDGFGFTRARLKVWIDWPVTDTDGSRRLYARYETAVVHYEERVAADGAAWGFSTRWISVIPGGILDIPASQDSGSSLTVADGYVEVEFR